MNLEKTKNKTVSTILMFSIPSIISMLLTSLISIVDGFFIGNYVGEEGLAAVNLGLPALYLYLAVGLMVSVGGIAIGGIALGAGELKKCKSVFNQTIITTIAISFALSVILISFFPTLMPLLHVTEELEVYFKSYYQIMLFVYPIMITNSALGMFVRGEGKPQIVMFINVICVISNIVLDYLFVYVFRHGVAGTAIASMISILLGSVCFAIYFIRKAKVYRFGSFQFSGEILKSTLLNGGSEFIGELSMSIAVYAYNWVIMKNIGVEGVAAFTIAGYLSYIFNMIVIGFGQGMSPLVSFCFGANEKELAQKVRRKTNILVVSLGAAVVAVLLLLSKWYSGLFVENEAVTMMVEGGIPIYITSFLILGFNTIGSMYFTSIGRAKESAVISSSRGLVVLLILIFTLPKLFGMTGVWLVGPLTELATVFITSFCLIKDRQTEYRACAEGGSNI